MTDAGQFVTNVNAPDETVFYGAIGGKSGKFKRQRFGPVPNWIGAYDNFQDDNRQLSSFTSEVSFPETESERRVFGTGTFTATDEFGDSFTSRELRFSQKDTPIGNWVDSNQRRSKERALFLETAINGLNAGIVKFGNGETRSMATFVGGTASSLSSIQALGNNVIAHYNGVFLRAPTGSHVSMRLNLSNATWGGNFHSNNAGFGVRGGTISGSSLTASTENFSSNVVNGSINANFFGNNAEAIAGIADVELMHGKFRAAACDGPCGPGPQPLQIPVEMPTERFVDTFVTIKTGESPIPTVIPLNDV